MFSKIVQHNLHIHKPSCVTGLVVMLNVMFFYSDSTSPDLSSHYACADESTFIANDKVCDGIEQCPDGDDEMKCS